MIPLFTLDQAAAELGITPEDASDPARLVRTLIKKHSVPFVRCGRTVKLRPQDIEMLAESMVVRPADSGTTLAMVNRILEQNAPKRGTRQRSTIAAVPNPMAKGRRRPA